MGWPKGLTLEDVRERDKRILELTQRNVPIRLIAEQLGIHERSVMRARNRMNMAKPSPRRFTAEEIAQVESMLADGCSIAEVARTIGRHPATVWNRWPHRGWTNVQCGEWSVLMSKVRRELGL